MKFAAALWVQSAGEEATGRKYSFQRRDCFFIYSMLITPSDTYYFIGGMIINTQDTNFSIGVMVINTQDTNYSIGGMVINSQD